MTTARPTKRSKAVSAGGGPSRHAAKKAANAGFTLVEIMIATLVLIVAVLGASAFRYSTALSTRKADAQMNAARIASLLCESWQGVDGTEIYDPAVHLGSELALSQATLDAYLSDVLLDPALADGFYPLGTYTVAIDNISYYAALCYKDVNTSMRVLNINVAWPQQAASANVDGTSYGVFKLTTYVQKQ